MNRCLKCGKRIKSEHLCPPCDKANSRLLRPFRKRGECYLCGKEVAIKNNGVPFRHQFAGKLCTAVSTEGVEKDG